MIMKSKSEDQTHKKPRKYFFLLVFKNLVKNKIANKLPPQASPNPVQPSNERGTQGKKKRIRTVTVAQRQIVKGSTILKNNTIIVASQTPKIERQTHGYRIVKVLQHLLRSVIGEGCIVCRLICPTKQCCPSCPSQKST